MLPVPEASLPAVEICSESSAAGYTCCATLTLKSGMNTTFSSSRVARSWLTTSATEWMSLMTSLASQ
jgi:hypothetical protein